MPRRRLPFLILLASLLLTALSASAITRQTLSWYAHGNILGTVTNGVVNWSPARPTGYGAVSGYRPPQLGSGADISLASAWRGRWADITGYHQIGLRPYDSISGLPAERPVNERP